MSSLKAYQQGNFRTEKAEYNEVSALIRKVLPLYELTFQEDHWPYAVEHGKQPQPVPGEYSTSTNAMILVMLTHMSEYADFIKKDSKKESSQEDSQALPDIIEKAQKKYFDKTFVGMDNKDFATTSGSYGKNDPLNLLWAYKLCSRFNEKQHHFETLKKEIKERIEKIQSAADLKGLLKLEDSPPQQAHSFVALYAYRAACLAGLSKTTPGMENFVNFFELRLHQHLSFHNIPDSRFDPAELVFCLEGSLLCQPDSVSAEVLHRVFEVLEKAQEITPCWRPVNPVYATPQGRTFLPLSIEVGNSLLRIFEIIDKENRPFSYFSKYISLFQRYFRWLKAQVKTIDIKKEDNAETVRVSGWESEHVGNEKELHLWQTAMVLRYLVDYRNLLQKHIAKQYLAASGLTVQYREDFTYDDACLFSEGNPFPEYDGFQYNVPARVYESFLEPRKKGHCAAHKPCGKKDKCHKGKCCSSHGEGGKKEADYSLLLYGPPGTGKTYFTKEMAKCLQWKHITVTPSDFLADGSAEIEARAKGIFACLMEQKDAVILFDEIDQFILDRDSDRYRNQGDVFKLLTPGMLPKFQDLRDKKNCIFVIATNYAERIDPAIVRVGRVDDKLPLMPPSWNKRFNICKKELEGVQANDLYYTLIATKTLYYTWKELTSLLKRIKKDDPSCTDPEMVIKKNGSANISAKKVLSKNKKLHDFVIEELALMHLLGNDSIKTDSETIRISFGCTDYQAKLIATKVKEILPVSLKRDESHE